MIVTIAVVPVVVLKKNKNGGSTSAIQEPPPPLALATDSPSMLRTSSPSITPPSTSILTTSAPSPTWSTTTTKVPITTEPTTASATTAPPTTKETTTTPPIHPITATPTTAPPTGSSFVWAVVGDALAFQSDDYVPPNLDEIDDIIPSAISLSLSGDGKILVGQFEEMYVDRTKDNQWSLDYHKFVRIYYRRQEEGGKNESSWAPIPLDGARGGSGAGGGGGIAVSADGTTVALGDPGNNAVRAYRIRMDDDDDDDDGGGGGGARAHRLRQLGDEIVYDGADRAANGFGRYLALNADGTVLAAGIPGADRNEIDDGAVRAYRFDDDIEDIWTRLGGEDVAGEDYADASGSALDLSDDGTVLAVGARGNDGGVDDEGRFSLRGHVRVYRWNSRVQAWSQLGNDIDGEGTYDEAGSSVVLSSDGHVVAVASAGADRGKYCKDYGKVRVFRYDEQSGEKNGEWTQWGQSMTGEACGDRFGTSVAVSGRGDVVAVGSFRNDGSSSESDANSGQVRVFRMDRDEGVWKTLGDALRGERGDGLGSAVALDSSGTTLAVGSSGFYTVWGNGDISIGTSG
eukprot:CAMPEP_0113558256 /NCGR_PEP_ID=MMETSP0015_2-20120614/18247_1 /TAXON_ID=2838 /ORGANISM="Odontella" /LENGTH=571 /DNA_ID=CAMNT_0000459775 /DNA_START=72 /DNA_END=1784 /DNA_ORIENTATION=+ /assembly_acc=CAM_ASM_000160